MSEVYRKEGRVVRYENGRVVFVVESGEAIEDGASFSCRPSGASVDVPVVAADGVEEVARTIAARVPSGVRVERLVITDGVAAHHFAGRTWSERSRRIHLSLASGTLRLLIDRGDFELDDIGEIADALARAGGERVAPQRIRLRASVSAALLPSLIGVAPPNITLLQQAGGLDGKGVAIEERRLDLPPWPNWYRPSYRVRPVRVPLNIRAQCAVKAVEEDLPVAVALLAPVEGLVLRVLCVDKNVSYPTVIRVNRIEAAGDDVRWYPYAAGSFGAEMVL